MNGVKKCVFTYVLSFWVEGLPSDFVFKILVFHSENSKGVEDNVLVCTIRVFLVI